MEYITCHDYGTQKDAVRVGYDWEGYEEGKTNADIFAEILGCENLNGLRHITFANWEGAFEGEGCQPIVDWLVANRNQLPALESLEMADMDSEECELSWIIQADYSTLWKAYPRLRRLRIQGADALSLGRIDSDNLEELVVFCGGLPRSCIAQVEKARAPRLAHLELYLGVDNYGFDGSAKDIEQLLANANFPALRYLGLCNSEIATDVARLVCASRFAAQLETLDISKSVFTDESAAALLEGAANLKNLKKLDLSYHYVSDAMQKKLAALPFAVDLSRANRYDDKQSYYNTPMYTE